MAEKAEARMKPMMALRMPVRKDQAEGQNAEDGEPDDEFAAEAVANGATHERAGGDGSQEDEEMKLGAVDGDAEALN
jgi:hypothetical protein